MSAFEIIASNGRETTYTDPTSRWGYTDGDDSFIDEIAYRPGDTITAAVARLQDEGKLPTGEAEVVKRERLDDYWVHEEHPYRYHVTVTVTE